jgi:hypothetical protein
LLPMWLTNPLTCLGITNRYLVVWGDLEHSCNFATLGTPCA